MLPRAGQGLRYHPARMPDTLQRLLGAIGAATTLPLVALLALLVRLDSPGPWLYASRRTGAGGRAFSCHKLRTMRTGASSGPALTGPDDPRVTRVGSWLRRTRLDELPQLWDVARGAMRLVGPRPEDPRFVDLADPVQHTVFTAKPGITGLAQLYFADEARLLEGTDPERRYREVIQPRKLRFDLAYLRHRSAALDLWILAATPWTVLRGRPPRLPRSLGAAVGGEGSAGA